MLLYVHRFEGTDEDSVREEFFGGLKSLERDKNVSGSGERMVAFHHTNDCGFILTARGEEFAEIVVEEPAEIAENPEPTQWDVLTDMVRRGQYEQALVVAHDLVRKQPWHRQGYMTGSMLASFLGYELTTDEISSLGAMYFPAQAELHYWSGLARRRQGQIAESEAPLRKAVELDQGLIAAQFFLAHTLIDQRKFKQLGLFLAEHSAVKSDDRRGLLLMERMRQWLRWRRVMVWAGVISQLLGLVVVLFAGFIGLVPILSGLIITWVGARAFKSQLNRLTELHRFDDMVYWNRRIHRSTVGHSEAS